VCILAAGTCLCGRYSQNFLFENKETRLKSGMKQAESSQYRLMLPLLFRSLHGVDVGSVVDVSELHYASTFRVKVSREGYVRVHYIS
jgi:hypothetical protein